MCRLDTTPGTTAERKRHRGTLEARQRSYFVIQKVKFRDFFNVAKRHYLRFKTAYNRCSCISMNSSSPPLALKHSLPLSEAVLVLMYFFVMNMDRLGFHIALIRLELTAERHRAVSLIFWRRPGPTSRASNLIFFLLIYLPTDSNIDTGIFQFKCSMVRLYGVDCIFQGVFSNVNYFCRKIKEAE